MIGHYISAFVIIIIFIDDWDLSENNTDHLAPPARTLNQTAMSTTSSTNHYKYRKGLKPVLAFRLNLSSDVNIVSQCLTTRVLTRRGLGEVPLFCSAPGN